MSSYAFSKAASLVERLERMPPEERDRISEENVRRTEAEYRKFASAFGIGGCYICGNPLTSFSKKSPCLHWFLRPKGFKKKNLPEIARRFGFFQIQTYLRWVANTEGFAKHINDLPEEGSGTKLIELTIRYKNIEWSFSCAESDYVGHQTSQHAKHPHYHVQMRVDQRPFIDYSDFHVLFAEGDILSIEAKRRLPHIVKHKFPFGEGMADVLNDDTVETLIASSSGEAAEEDAALHFDTLVMADEGTTIRGEDLYNIIQEAKTKGVTIASLVRNLPNASTRVLVTPGPGVVEQAPRTGRKQDA